MRKLFFASLAALAISVCSCGGNKTETVADTTGTAVEATDTTAVDKVVVLKSEKGLPMLADFSAEWCPPCRQMKPTFKALQKEFEGKVELVTVDVDENPELAAKYKVESIPTLVYISPSGEEVYRTVGLQTEDLIREAIGKYLKN